MLDIIIPVYKNKKGLYSTLMSIGTNVSNKIYVTIVDDCSEENYDEIIEFFQKVFPIRVIYLKNNLGPGIARQIGLEKARQEFVTFIDCGDLFSSPLALSNMIKEIEENPNFNMYCWSHLEEDTNTNILANNNRIHGKIYNRNFLKQNNITFCQDYPRANEDIGFNHACRMVNAHIAKEQNIDTVYHNNEIAIIWKVDENSITRLNNHAFYYKEQNLGLAFNMKHAISIAEINNVDKHIIATEVYNAMAHIYFFYISTVNSRPEFIEEALQGAILYYNTCFKKYASVDPELFKEKYYEVFINLLSENESPLCKKIVNFNIIDFLNMLENINIEKE